MGIIRWEDPPERQYKSASKIDKAYQMLDVGEVLKQQPLKWALIKICESPSKAAAFANLLNARDIKLPDGKFEFVSRTVDGECRVYGRFLGKSSIVIQKIK